MSINGEVTLRERFLSYESWVILSSISAELLFIYCLEKYQEMDTCAPIVWIFVYSSQQRSQSNFYLVFVSGC